MKATHERARLEELQAMLVAYEPPAAEDPDEDPGDWRAEVRDEVWRLEAEIREARRPLRRAA